MCDSHNGNLVIPKNLDDLQKGIGFDSTDDVFARGGWSHVPSKSYTRKYLKYKKKYLQTKYNLQHGGINKQRTYMCYLNDSQLDMSHFHDLMKSRNWTQISMNSDAKYIDFIWIDYVHKRPQVDDIKCAFKNNLSDKKSVLVVKETLHNILQTKYPELSHKHLPETRNLQDIEKLHEGEVLIIRPSGRGFFSGIGISVVTNNDELIKEQIKNKTEKIRLREKMYPVRKIASTYIKNPLLWQGLKVHIRMYMLINIYPKYECKMFNIGKIMTAKLPYIASDYHNKEIHDTHMGSTPKNLFFPKDFSNVLSEKDIKSILGQTKEIVDVLGEIYKPYAIPYPESKTAFEIFGIDFMVDSSLNVFLIEVNDKVGYGAAHDVIDDAYKQFSYDYFDWTYHNAIEPLIDRIDDLDKL